MTNEQLWEVYNSALSDDPHAVPLRAIALAARKEALEELRKILKARSKGEVETWGFVAMFLDMINEVEQT